MKKCLCLVLPLLVIGVAHAQNPPLDTPVAPPVADKIELKPHWTAGKKYLQTVHTVAKTSQTIDKKRMDMTQDMTLGMVLNFKDVVAEGAANVELAYRSVQMTMHIKNDAIQTDTTYDSQHPPKKADPATAPLAALVGLKFQMKMSPEGKLLNIQGLDAMRNRLIKAMNVPPGNARATFEAMMKKQLSDEAMRKMIEKNSGFTNTDIYPGKPVALGESWTRSTTFDTIVPITKTTTYTLRDHADGVAHLDLGGKFALSTSNASPTPSVKVAMKMSGNQTGNVDLRESDGLVTKMQSALRYAGTITSTGPDVRAPKKTVTKSWPIYASVTVTMESKDLP